MRTSSNVSQHVASTSTAIVPYVSSKTRFSEACRKKERAYLIGGRTYTIRQAYKDDSRVAQSLVSSVRIRRVGRA